MDDGEGEHPSLSENTPVGQSSEVAKLYSVLKADAITRPLCSLHDAGLRAFQAKNPPAQPFGGDGQGHRRFLDTGIARTQRRVHDHDCKVNTTHGNETHLEQLKDAEVAHSICCQCQRLRGCKRPVLKPRALQRQHTRVTKSAHVTSKPQRPTRAPGGGGGGGGGVRTR